MPTNDLIPKFSDSLPNNYIWDTNLDRDSDEVMSFIRSIWPRYLTEESDISILVPYEAVVYDRYYSERYFLWGIRRQSDRQLVACLSCASIDLEGLGRSLDQQGWQWAKQNSILSDSVNSLSLLSATVSTEERANGLAKWMIESAKDLAKSLGFKQVVAPARPSLKHRYPEITMQDYLLMSGIKFNSLDDELSYLGKDGTKSKIPVDPWLALHLDLGAKILNICENSIEVVSSIGWWEKVLATSFKRLNEINIDTGLAPLKIDWNKKIAIYQEPNVWLEYQLVE